MRDSELTEIKGKTVIINQTNATIDDISPNDCYLSNMNHEANLAIITLRNFKPKHIKVRTNDDIEYGLFETLQQDGISVERI
ncbi:hypothetical protein [Pseudoalteromonas galatheae]|uniref:hypothetical protein n=1 Tax=Pseudoalteromonas galatheae TaxID=579562 RepID=UPI0030CC1D65